MDHKKAKFFIKSLLSRMTAAGEGSWRLEGPVSSVEYDALCYIAESGPGIITNARSEAQINARESPVGTMLDGSLSEPSQPLSNPNDDESCVVVSQDVLEELVRQSTNEDNETDSVHSSRIGESFSGIKIDTAVDEAEVLSAKLRDFVVPSSLLAIQDVVLGALGDSATLADLIKTSDKDLLKGPGFGAVKLQKARVMQQEMLEGKYRIDSILTSSPDASIGEKDIFHGVDDIPLDELEHVLLEGIEKYICQLDERDKYVFVSRYGWKTRQITLDETGKNMPGGSITRERVRQLQQRVNRNLLSQMPVSPKTLWVNIKSNLSLLGVPLFPRLRACFVDEDTFFEFLEICCAVKAGRITSVTRPAVKNNILDEYWTRNLSPASVADVSEYLQSEHGFEHAVADNALVMLEKNDVIEISGLKVIPKKLPKSVAYAHVLLLFPSGEDWYVIQEKANTLGLTRNDLPLHRLDAGAAEAVDAGWIYQSEKGQYRSLVYLDLTQDDIEHTLTALRKRLEEEKADARNSINLSVDFYESSPQKMDYFVVRHIARAFGEREGIFFNGKSGADTVSLDKEFSLASQKKAIVDMFIKSKVPLTRQRLAEAIRSKSVGHATYYLDALIKENTVVRIESNAYALAVKVFQGADIPGIVKTAAKLIEEKETPVGSEILQRHINRELDLEYNKYFYLSLLRIHAPELGYPWYFSRDHVSRRSPDPQ